MIVLDEIKDSADQPGDLDERVLMECETSDIQTVLALGYRYVDELLPESARIHAKIGSCGWPSTPP